MEGEEEEGGGCAAGERDDSGSEEDGVVVVVVAAAAAADGDLEDENEEDNDADVADTAFDVCGTADNVLDAVDIEDIVAVDDGNGFVGTGFTGVAFDSTFVPETGESSLLCCESIGAPCACGRDEVIITSDADGDDADGENDGDGD